MVDFRSFTAPVPLPAHASPCTLLCIETRIPAGFPSPAQDYLEESIDLSGYMIDNPAATYVMRVEGNSMQGAGIMDGSLVIVDRSVEAVSGKIVIAYQCGEFTIKRLRKDRNGQFWLCPENPDYQPIRCLEDCQIWGVVVGCIQRF